LPRAQIQWWEGAVPQPVTILIVEDEQDQLTIMTHMLIRAGYRLVPAYGAEDAIHKAKTQKIDLVVTDLAMPKVSGVEVVRARAAYAHASTEVAITPGTQPVRIPQPR
jgi:CheY-like chemotaxis protein